nr:hypothetical transcript [Hymenolepis microstoma]
MCSSKIRDLGFSEREILALSVIVNVVESESEQFYVHSSSNKSAISATDIGYVNFNSRVLKYLLFTRKTPEGGFPTGRVLYQICAIETIEGTSFLAREHSHSSASIIRSIHYDMFASMLAIPPWTTVACN